MDQGELLRDEGIQRAVEHADAVEVDWSERAYRWLERMRFRRPGFRFTTEQLRAFSLFDDIPEPPDARAWGGIAVRAARAGLIEATGEFKKCMSPIGHRRDVRVWKFR